VSNQDRRIEWSPPALALRPNLVRSPRRPPAPPRVCQWRARRSRRQFARVSVGTHRIPRVVGRGSAEGHCRSQSAKSGLGHQREAVRRIGAGERRDEPFIIKRCHLEGRAYTGRDRGCHQGRPEVTKEIKLLGFWSQALSPSIEAHACYRSSTSDCMPSRLAAGPQSFSATTSIYELPHRSESFTAVLEDQKGVRHAKISRQAKATWSD
jgi:hypothetical protein